MSKLIVRAVFIITPALYFGFIFSLLHPVVGLLVAIGVVGLGIQLTEAKPERGEGL